MRSRTTVALGSGEKISAGHAVDSIYLSVESRNAGMIVLHLNEYQADDICKALKPFAKPRGTPNHDQ